MIYRGRTRLGSMFAKRHVLLTTAAALFLPGAAWAAEGGQIEEIVVTARKTAESLQTVPLSVTALTAETLARAGAGDLQSVAGLTPGLSFSEMAGNGIYSLPVIRGLAQLQVFAAETSVPIFLDGIYLSNRQAMNIPMLDTERVEVIKGPQATLYGQSAYAGAINYITKDPGDAFEGVIGASAGSHQWFDGKLAVGGPINDRVGFRVAASASTFDGTFKNIANPTNNLQGYHSYNGSGTLVFKPSDALKIRAKVYYSEYDTEESAEYEAANNCGVDTLGRPSHYCGVIKPQKTFDISPEASGSHTRSVIGSVLGEYAINDAFRISSLTGYIHAKQYSVLDGDFSSIGYPLTVRNTVTNVTRIQNANRFFSPGNETDEGFNEELRVNYTGQRASLMLGGYYFANTAYPATLLAVDNRALLPNEVFTNFTAALFPGTPTTQKVATQTILDTHTKAVFGQGSLRVTDALRASAEVRWTQEDRKIQRILNFGSIDGRIQTATWKFWTPRFSIDYQPSQRLMVYASAARGYRAGNFNSNGAPTKPEESRFNPETNWTYELGVRSAWLDNRLVINASVFHTELKNLQVAIASALPGVFITGNAGAARSSGFEAQAEATLTKELSGGVGYAYTDPKFKGGQVDYSYLGCGVGNLICPPRDALGGVDISGKQLPNSSRHQFSVHATLTEPLRGRWEWYLRGDVVYKSGMPFDTLNLARSDGYALVNVRLGIQDEKYELALWAKNLFDKQYVSGSVTGSRLTGLTTNQVEQGNGRIFGLTAQMKF